MGLTYCVIKETYMLSYGEYNSFGIAAVEVADGVPSVIVSLHNCADEFETLALLTKRCNELKLSPEHLADVMENFLCEYDK